MRYLPFAVLLVTVVASAQQIDCPKFVPSDDLPLSATPAGRTGSGRLRPSHLSFAYMYSGALYSELDMQTVGKKVKGGTDTQYHFTQQAQNWLVCVYGGNEWTRSEQLVVGNVEWWEKLDPKISRCVLKVREIKEKDMPISWTATASCQ